MPGSAGGGCTPAPSTRTTPARVPTQTCPAASTAIARTWPLGTPSAWP